MNKVHIWTGTFEKEKEFNDYVERPEQLAQEIALEFLDEDFLHMHFEQSGSFEAFLSRIPADLKKVQKSLKDKGITDANAFICFDKSQMDKTSVPELAKKMDYIGLYTYTTPTPLITDEATRLGFTDAIWIGRTKQSKDAFLKYFDQAAFGNENQDKQKKTNPFSCDFAADTGMPYYTASRTLIYYSEEAQDWKVLVKEAIKNKALKQRLLDSSLMAKSGKVNVLVHIAQDKTPNGKSEPKVKIFPKESAKRYPVPKGYNIEKDDYNGMKFIGNFSW